MGLKLTLPKEKNGLYYDFIDAYWAISDILYTTKEMEFTLKAYPTREAKLRNNTDLTDRSFGFGASRLSVVDSWLYVWRGMCQISEVFPNGIPVDENEQKTAVYNYVKAYTGLPFEDVFEN